MTRTARGALVATLVTALLSTGMTVGGGTATAAVDAGLGYDPVANKGSLWHLKEVVGVNALHRAGYSGKGIGVALIDTGVAEVRGLDTGNVFHGPDLSFDSQDPELTRKDAYGHGTHLASIIAGRDAAGAPTTYASQSSFYGIAPDVNLLSVKVGASDGAVDVTQVIAAIDWVVEHRNDNGMNIRVINLAYGTDSVQDPLVDPLAYAVEQAWKAGIVVVVAGGNDGSDRMVLAQPAQDPTIFAVGAADTQGTVDSGDDTVPAWATRGTDKRHVDLVAPGVSVLGARVPNGYADQRNVGARVGQRFATASGTSQAAAVVSGAAALLLQAQPRLTPDQVKGHLMSTANSFDSTTTKYRGKGMLDVAEAVGKKAGSYKPYGVWSTGSGSIEESRGTSHVHDGVSELRGEVDIFGNPWDSATWANLSARGTAWSGGNWRGWTWSGDGWEARSWRGTAWSAGTWSARSWRDSQWAARSWRDGSWTGEDWSARSWREGLWSARSWRSADLASVSWHSHTWR